MAPRLIPEHPKFETATEREVWEVLRAGLGPDDVLMANLRLSDEAKDHEADIVAIIGGAGVVVIEVKGGSVGVVDGQWRQSGNDKRTFDPVDQARTTKYAIRQYVEADPRWSGSSRRRIRWAHSVALPNTDLHDDFSMPDCPRWAVHGAGDIATGDAAAQQGGGPWWRRKWQDGVGADPGQTAFTRSRGTQSAAGRHHLLLTRSGGVPQSRRGDLGPQTTPRLRGHVPCAGSQLGRTGRQS
ncbi:MAG: nuclease-related domain-containing protein [Dermatophilaceae bacterium]